MLSLLQINAVANSGSTGKIAECLGQLAKTQGWRSVIAYGRWANNSQSELLKVGSSSSVYEHVLESRLLDNQGLASRSGTKKLIKCIDEISPSVIHLHNLHGYYLNYQLLFEYLNSTSIPIVWTLHDCWSFTGHCAHFITANCEKWKTGCYNCPLKGNYPSSIIDQSQRNFNLKKQLFKTNNNLHIVPVSDWLACLVRQSFLKNKDIRVIKNGVDLSVFKPNPLVQSHKYRILGVSSVWNKDKGLFDFFKLKESLNKEKYEIILVGLSKNQIKELPEGIIGIERTETAAKLASLYSSASLLVNPTYADTYPTVNMEALACGTPVITYRTGGSPETVTSDTGWVVEPGDIDSIARIIGRFTSSDESSVRAKRKACRERALHEFDRNKCFEKYLELYQEIMS